MSLVCLSSSPPLSPRIIFTARKSLKIPFINLFMQKKMTFMLHAFFGRESFKINLHPRMSLVLPKEQAHHMWYILLPSTTFLFQDLSLLLKVRLSKIEKSGISFREKKTLWEVFWYRKRRMKKCVWGFICVVYVFVCLFIGIQANTPRTL